MGRGTHRCAAALGLLAAIAPGAATEKAAKWMVVHTWPWTQCADASAVVLEQGGSAMDALVAGLSVAELDLSVDSVGFGAHPDSSGEPTLDAAVMDGKTARIGAVGGLRSVKHAAHVARLVLEHTRHTLLVGAFATNFAVSFGGLPQESLRTNASDVSWESWRSGGCQPNYWASVTPDPLLDGCGPFLPLPVDEEQAAAARPTLSPENHDTISMAVLDGVGNIVSGTSTNGLAFKIAGRVGDAAVPGSGNYARNDIGACGATGDGDVLMRFLPCYQALESLRLGWSPVDAAEDALRRIAAVDDSFQGALFVVTADGRHAGASHNWVFQYVVRSASEPAAAIYTVHPRGPDFVPRGPDHCRQADAASTHKMYLAFATLGSVVTYLLGAVLQQTGVAPRAPAADMAHTHHEDQASPETVQQLYTSTT